MGYAQLSFETQNASLAPVEEKPRFKVLEGGLSLRQAQESFSRPSAGQAAPAPRFREISEAARKNRPSGLPVALIAAFLALSICVVSMIASHIYESKLSSDLASVPGVEYTVASGDSLWVIAANHPIEGHTTSDVVTWILERNELETSLIIPGQELLVPSQLC